MSLKNSFQNRFANNADRARNPRNIARKIAAVAFSLCAFALMLALAGCAAPQVDAPAEGEDKPLSSSEYMAQVNQTVEELNERLQSFNDAVSRQDPITMRTQADSAFAVLDQLAAIEAPDDVKDLRDQYVQGCDQLKGALNDYVNLYSEMTAAKAQAESSRYNDPFDASVYADRIAEIQNQYNEGIQTLEDADSSAKDR